MEKRTKPLLLALARGEPCNIDFILQNLLATWSAKTAMTGEFSDPDSAAIPLIERKFFNDQPKTSIWMEYLDHAVQWNIMGDRLLPSFIYGGYFSWSSSRAY